ncbi:MAG: radical SAM family heme chaperone HemW [Alphaproteobacteria bacterium]|nr:radical SAM family heme chaperone HemW [Alphaproteobacteria bacterium]
MNCSHNIYIHVPFCVKKCNYCAFYSVACGVPDWEKYTNDICKELIFWSEKLGKIIVPTIFFGGGTPSLMPVTVFERIIKCITDNFDVLPNCEITLESNPGTLDGNKLKDFVSCGVNRLSVGVQSLDDEELKFLGRIHNVSQSLMLLKDAADMGIRVSADFIYGLPNQNEKNIVNMCQKINKLDLKHVSLYELTIEKNTVFGKMNLNMPNNETMANMYMAISDNLNLPRYEVSNYAKIGHECKHNQNIWAGEAYIGIGKAAAGRINIDGIWYEQKGHFEQFDVMNEKDRAVEKIITGIRTVRGVKLTPDVEKQIDFDWVKNHTDLINQDNEYLYATSKGLLLLDNLTLDLIK